tara:strand:+ start:459 stop:1097 length:639 start_codon:yes stop_codon:yes gene_type:complete
MESNTQETQEYVEYSDNPSLNGYSDYSPEPEQELLIVEKEDDISSPTIQKEVVEVPSVNEDIVELSKELQKPKKPRTEKQKQALIKAQATRKANIAKKKEQSKPQKPPHKKLIKKPKVVYEEDPSSEEEVVIIKKKKKKKKQKIVYVEPSSSEEDSEEEEEEIIEKQIQKPKRGYKKKVNLKVEDSDSEDEAYEYQYEVQQPLKYSDVFKFS